MLLSIRRTQPLTNAMHDGQIEGTWVEVLVECVDGTGRSEGKEIDGAQIGDGIDEVGVHLWQEQQLHWGKILVL